MSARLFRSYFATEQRYNTSGDIEGNDDDELLYPYSCSNKDNRDEMAHVKQKTNGEPDIEKDDDDSESLQDVPFSSSSVDRSSIGSSIPWADDAIKKNKLDWDRVERMLSGEEALPEQEPDLRHEIADWQRKFPSLVGRKVQPLKQQSFDSSSSHHQHRMIDDSGDIDSMSNLSLNSLSDDNDDDDGFLTPTADRQLGQIKYQDSRQQYLRSTQPHTLMDVLDKDLRITSVKLRSRERTNQPHLQTQYPQQPLHDTHSATASRSRLRMPPILNVLDSNRRFRGLLNNRSFVQLTQVQQQQQLQAKSAALTHANSAERQGNRSAWHMPMAAASFSSRFFNNKNAIVLPSLNRQRNFSMATATTSQSNSSGGGAHNSHSNSSSLNGRRPMERQQQYPHQFYHHRQFNAPTNSSNTPSTGRSISAAVHHPRPSEYVNSAFYIPYSASKFKAFK